MYSTTCMESILKVYNATTCTCTTKVGGWKRSLGLHCSEDSGLYQDHTMENKHIIVKRLGTNYMHKHDLVVALHKPPLWYMYILFRLSVQDFLSGYIMPF